MTAVTENRQGPIAEILAARERLEQARTQGTELRRIYVDRSKAQLGQKIVVARVGGTKQTQIQEELGLKSRDDVRILEVAYRKWIAEHPDDDLRRDADWPAILQQAGFLQMAS
jgi:hypothetical protein